MSEKEIRSVIQAVCADLDRRVRDAVSQSVRKVVLPTALGAGLALGSGCDNGRTVNAGDADVGVTSDAVSSDAVDGPPAVPPYMAPDDFQVPDGRRRDARLDYKPAIPPYMAPDPDAGVEPPPEPDYMAPNPDPDPVPLYDAPPP